MEVSDLRSQCKGDSLPILIQFNKMVTAGTSESDLSTSTQTAASEQNEALKRKIRELRLQLKGQGEQHEKELAEATMSKRLKGKNQKKKEFDKKNSMQSDTEKNVKGYVRNTLFSAIKYNEGHYRDESFRNVCHAYNISTESEMERLKDHVMHVIDSTINSSRNNCIKALKAAVWQVKDGTCK